MKNQSFFWEIKDILTQFVAALDDTVVKRYNNNREAKETIEVRYVLAPKQRVIYDIVNKAQNLTLPCAAVNITGITRDQARVFNKIEPTYLPAADKPYGSKMVKLPPPIPINIEVSVSFISKFMSDMDQIISNFVPYSNPYIILSWPIPKEFGLAETAEIRTEVVWGGSVSYNSPTDISYSDKYRIVADTSFTIKSWLFREVKEPAGIIYKVINNFHNVRLDDSLYSPTIYNTISGYDTTDVVTVSAHPQITNMFYATTGQTVELHDNINVDMKQNNMFVLYGKNFNYSNTFYIQTDVDGFYGNRVPVNTAESPPLYAYPIDNLVSVLNNNIFTVSIPVSTFTQPGNVTLITANSAGWTAANYSIGIVID